MQFSLYYTYYCRFKYIKLFHKNRSLPDIAALSFCLLALLTNGLLIAFGLRKNLLLPWGGVGQLWTITLLSSLRGLLGLVLGNLVGDGHSVELLPSCRLWNNCFSIKENKRQKKVLSVIKQMISKKGAFSNCWVILYICKFYITCIFVLLDLILAVE